MTACRPSPGAMAAHRIAAATREQGDLLLRDPYALEPIGKGAVPVYLHLVNRGTVPDTLLSASSGAAGMVMLHGLHMDALAALPVPAGDSTLLAPAGRHIMLDMLSRPVVAGDSVLVALHFARGGDVSLFVPVISYQQFDQLPASIRPPAH